MTRKATPGPCFGKKLVQFITEQKQSGCIVMLLHIQQKALKLSTNPSFEASTG